MNAERTARGLGRLQAEPLLGRVASSYARQMVARASSTTSPPSARRLARIQATSYLRDGGVLVAGREPRLGHRPLATPRAIVRGWMHSAGHRANILNRHFRDVGIGIAAGAPIALEPASSAAPT